MRRTVTSAGNKIPEIKIAMKEVNLIIDSNINERRPLGSLANTLGRRLFPDMDQITRDAAASVVLRYGYAKETKDRKDKSLIVKACGRRAEIIINGKTVLD